MLHEKKSRWKAAVVVLAVLAAGGAIFGGAARSRILARHFPEEALRVLIEPFAGRRWARENADEDEARGTPPRTGRLILIIPPMAQSGKRSRYVTDMDAPRIDLRPFETFPPRIHSDWYKLDPSVRAATPDEVDTVVICEQDTDIVGYYAGAPKYASQVKINEYAHVRKCRIKVFDRETEEFLGMCVVKGSAPADEIGRADSHTGDAPDVAGVIEATAAAAGARPPHRPAVMIGNSGDTSFYCPPPTAPAPHTQPASRAAHTGRESRGIRCRSGKAPLPPRRCAIPLRAGTLRKGDAHGGLPPVRVHDVAVFGIPQLTTG